MLCSVGVAVNTVPVGEMSTVMKAEQSFIDQSSDNWISLDILPGVKLLPLAQPVPGGSIHRARLEKGTVIPIHTHPSDEYVYVITGTVETGGRRCEAGAFWTTPKDTSQGPHIALTDVELLTIRMGAIGSVG